MPPHPPCLNCTRCRSCEEAGRPSTRAPHSSSSCTPCLAHYCAACGAFLAGGGEREVRPGAAFLAALGEVVRDVRTGRAPEGVDAFAVLDGRGYEPLTLARAALSRMGLPAGASLPGQKKSPRGDI